MVCRHIRHHSFGVNLEVGYKTGYWPLSSSLRRKTAAAETSCWPDIHILNIHGPSGYGSELVLPLTLICLRGHPYKVPQVKSINRRSRLTFSAKVMKYWKALPATVVTASSVHMVRYLSWSTCVISVPLHRHCSLHFYVSHTPKFWLIHVVIAANPNTIKK